LSGEPFPESLALTKELLETAVKSLAKVYIIIDGLDECPRREEKAITSFFRFLVESIQESDPDTLRCLFVSQDDGEIGKLLSKVPKITMTPASTKGDIQAYSDVWSKKIESKFDLPASTRASIALTVAERANGYNLTKVNQLRVTD
jgi:hypothetical protein